MHYVSVEGLTMSYGIKPLFSDLSFHIEEGDKIALVALNGSGKSTLLKILAGKEKPDAGKIRFNKDVHVVLLEQDPLFREDLTILDNIFFIDHPIITAIREYEAAEESGNSDRLNSSIVKMDELGAWDFESRVKQVLGKLDIHHLDQRIGQLSGGQKKRVALARALIDMSFHPEHILLIMDEPTNHLDIEMVEWLEQWLDRQNLTLLLVTHDRYFLDNVCNEIWELDSSTLQSAGRLHFHKGNYADYLERKAARMESEAASIEKARNIWRRELEWMRKQPKARTTKGKARQDNFSEVEKKASQRIAGPPLRLQLKMNRLGGKTVEMKKVYKKFGDKTILKGFDYTFRKGERIGVTGRNALGKSTFINIIQGIEPADSGKINIGETVIFGNYSQEGLKLKEDMRVIEYVKSIAENFPLAEGGVLTAAEFLKLFLFDPDKQFTYVSLLSGGEKRRLHMLTVLFRNPNFLILDEPTNDLDLPTLHVLENFLSEFAGCLLIVSHDRYFMDRLVEHLFVFEGDGLIRDYPGNYSQYREWSDRQESVPAMETTEEAATNQNKPEKSRNQLSFKEKREFELLGKEIADLSQEKEIITGKLNSGDTAFGELQELSLRIGEVTRLLDEKELRWLELSELV